MCFGRWVTMNTLSLEAWRNYGLYPKEEWHHSMEPSMIIRRYSNQPRKGKWQSRDHALVIGRHLGDIFLLLVSAVILGREYSSFQIYNFCIFITVAISVDSLKWNKRVIVVRSFTTISNCNQVRKLWQHQRI